MAVKPPTSFRLTDECRSLIRQVADKLGVKDAAVIEIAVRRYAEQELGEADLRKGRTKRARAG